MRLGFSPADVGVFTNHQRKSIKERFKTFEMFMRFVKFERFVRLGFSPADVGVFTNHQRKSTLAPVS